MGKKIKPYWLQRGEGPFADQHFAIIPKIPPGWLTTKIYFFPFTKENYAYNPECTYERILSRLELSQYLIRYEAYGFDADKNLIRHHCKSELSDDDMLRDLLLDPESFLTSDDALCRFYKKQLSRLIKQSWTDKAEKEKLFDLLDRPQGIRQKKFIIPTYLYIDGLIEFVFRITQAIKRSFDLPRKHRDPRVKELSDDEQKLLSTGGLREASQRIVARKLIHREDTEAAFRTLKNLLADEKEILWEPSATHKHLIFKAPRKPNRC
jgi:hypothetical protein